MESFLTLLDKSTNSSDQAIESLRKKIVVKSVKKGVVLQSEGDIFTNLYYVKKGLLRSYTIDKKGKEHIFMFAPEGWLTADGAYLNAPSDLYISALEDSEVEVIDKKTFQLEFLPIENTNELTTTFSLQKRIAVLQKRIIMLMSATAIERYEHFETTYPQIIQRVPQKMIASYLGITPEALSSVKAKKIRNK